MTVPTKETTYTISANEQILAQSSTSATNKLVMLTFVKRLITMGWTCVGSSNGTTYDAVDGASHTSKWVTVDDLVYGGGSHSWIVLENTVYGLLGTGNPQFKIDLNNGGDQLQYAYHYFSPTGAFTGGDLSTAPSATDQQECAPFFDANSNQKTLHLSESGTYNPNGRLHIIMSNDGYATYAILCSAGHVTGIWGLIKAVDVAGSAWSAPWVSITVGQAYYQIYTGIYPSVDILRFRTKFGSSTSISALGIITENVCFYGDSNRYLLSRRGTYDQETEYFPFSPMSLWNNQSPYIGRKGRIRDLYLADTTIQPGTTYPSDGSKQWAQFGEFVFPWDGTNDIKTL